MATGKGKKKLKYQPAMARIEGGGIKRGLTAPEASVLLGRPLNLTLTLVIFEMLRKGLLTQQQASPLIVAIPDAFQTKELALPLEERKLHLRKAAQALPATLTLYEEAFLEIFASQPTKPVSQLDYTIAIQPFIRFVASRVGGFSFGESRAYYQALIERAPKEARSDGVLTTDRQKVFDRNFAFLLMHDEYAEIFDQADYSFQPIWWRSEATPLPDESFATWAGILVDSMQQNLSLESVNVELGEEEDLLSASLMKEISQATFYG